MGLNAHTRLWVENENGEVVFGSGRVRILEAVARTGSLNKAAREMGMSYRTIWGRIRDTERRLGVKLLKRPAGGMRGGSILTPPGSLLLERFKEWRARVIEFSDGLFDRLIAAEIERLKE